ncbi:MAG: cupin domain-containing protein [Desulfobacterales bacterium]|nr:cupin domain-containing protein [Desulfobacterales bacterium]
MKRKNVSEVAPVKVTQPGYKNMAAKYLWTQEDGCPNFAMRLMEFAPGGETSFHHHLEEHEFYIIDGVALLVDSEDNKVRLEPGDTVYLAPDEPHQICNGGDTTMRLLCMVPILPGGDGMSPAPRPPE